MNAQLDLRMGETLVTLLAVFHALSSVLYMCAHDGWLNVETLGDGPAFAKVWFGVLLHYPLVASLQYTYPWSHSGTAIVYTLRVNMSVASVAMKHDLNWSETDKGYVLVRMLDCAVILLHTTYCGG
jgi:hypothetical protein